MLISLASAAVLPVLGAPARAEPLMTIHKGPRCGCCDVWVRHMEKAGFPTRVIETRQLDALKARLGVPPDLETCHTAEIDGYVIEGHVPVSSIKRLLAEKPRATGLAVPGMPMESPGMEQGGEPEIYDVILFGPGLRQRYMRFKGNREL